MGAHLKARFIIEESKKIEYSKKEMYFQTKVAVFILVVTLNLHIIPAPWITNGQVELRGSLSNCEEEKNIWRPLTGWLCSDYEEFKWCENGGVGSGWLKGWKWSVDIDGLDARDVCPVCGGNERTSTSCHQYRGDNIVWWISRRLRLNLDKQGCEGGVEYLTNILGLKREVICGTLVDSIVEKMPIPEWRKPWIRKFYDRRGTCIDSSSTKFSDICGCSCSA